MLDFGFFSGVPAKFGVPRAPNYPLLYPKFRIPIITDHRASVKGPLGVLVGFGFYLEGRGT